MYFRVYAGNMFCGHLYVSLIPRQYHRFTSRHGGIAVSTQPLLQLIQYKKLNLKRTDRPRLSI